MTNILTVMESVSSSPESVSFLDNKDEVKKKVTFAMAQSPSQDSVASIVSNSVNSVNNNNSDILLITPGHDVVFTSSGSGDLVAKLQIQNISSKPVGYKIKTTSPEKYRVRPSTGSLAASSTAAVEIHVAGGQTAPGGLVRDKFLITGIYLASSDLTQQQLNEALKTQTPDCQYR